MKFVLTVLLAAVSGVCASWASTAAQTVSADVRVGTYNIRLATGDVGTPNAWENRKQDVVNLIRKMDLDAFGLQEVRPEQAAYFREQLPEWAFVGEHRGADRKSDEASPVFYRKSRFEALKSGTFWLSETPDVPGVRGWGAACPRVCSWMWLKDRKTGKTFCFANTHTDHVSALARKNGMLLVIARMKEFGGNAPIVFTGDHNCREVDDPAVAVEAILDNALYVSQTPPTGSWRTFSNWNYLEHEALITDALKEPKAARNASSAFGPRIDYIYVSKDVKVKAYATWNDVRPGTKLYPSDHFPVTAVVEF